MQQQQPVHPVIQNMHLAYTTDGSAVYKPVVSGNGSNGDDIGMSIGLKKKRGRPRKYGPDGSLPSPKMQSPMPISSAPPAVNAGQTPSGPFSPPPPQQQAVPSAAPQHSSPPPPSFKRRGRPPGSSRKQQMETLGSPGIGFTPHVITVKAGEDVGSRIMSFSQNGPRAICILSANGAISNVTLRQAATSGGSVTYEGRFEILSLSGSFMLSDSGGHRSRSGGLSVALAGPDGRVVGGGVAGLLTASTPVQIVVASFMADGRKEINFAHPMDPMSAPSKLHAGIGPTDPSSPPSDDSSDGPASPINLSTPGAVNNTPPPPGISGMPWK